MKRIEWTSESGRRMEMTIRHWETEQPETSYADGWGVTVGMEAVMHNEVTFSIDGRQVCVNDRLPELVDVEIKDGKARRASGKTGKRAFAFEKDGGCLYVGVSEAVEAEILAAIKAEIQENRCNARIQAEEAELNRRIADAKETVRIAESQNEILDAAGTRAAIRRYNQIHNEGGYGFVPRMVSREEYEAAKQVLAESRCDD